MTSRIPVPRVSRVTIAAICACLACGRPGAEASLAAGAASESALTATLTSQAQLGKAIFFDQNLSLNANQSCAMCHAAEVGWTGPSESVNLHGSVYEGSVPGAFGNRKPPSAAYAAQSPILHFTRTQTFVGGNFWDGRATGEKLGNPAADQAQGPFLNPVEQALPSPADVVAKLCASAYEALLLQVCPGACDPAATSAAYDCVALAVVAYEASPEVSAFSSKFDAVGSAKLTAAESKGFAIFMGKGKCGRCHVATPRAGRPLFTDHTFDNVGLPRNPENPFYGSPLNPLGEAWVDLGLGGFLGSRSDYAPFADANLGKQKVPTLRNVDRRPSVGFVKAYGHNGYFKSLARIVHFYNTRDVLPACSGSVTDAVAEAAGCWPAPEVAENLNTSELGNLGLSAADEAALVAFLGTLSDGWSPP